MITQPSMTPRSPARPGAGALRGRDMLCFSHDWTGDPLSKTHLMKLLARDNRVLWVNSIGYRAPPAPPRRPRGPAAPGRRPRPGLPQAQGGPDPADRAPAQTARPEPARDPGLGQAG